jgi:hypothetical protein
MNETHAITGPARGECLPPDRVGARVRLPLECAPTPRWSDALAARLATALTGHAAIGHLRLNHLVQGSEIVLEGVESAEAEALGPVLRYAIAAANHACEDGRGDGPAAAGNMDQGEADRLARAVEAGVTCA